MGVYFKKLKVVLNFLEGKVKLLSLSIFIVDSLDLDGFCVLKFVCMSVLGDVMVCKVCFWYYCFDFVIGFLKLFGKWWFYCFVFWN